MFINPNYTTRTVSDQSLAVDQSTKNEFNTSFSTISTIMDNRTQPTFVAMALEQLDIENVNIEERLLSNIDTIIIVGKYFRIFMIAVAVIQLISTIIMCKRRKPTLIAPIGSYHTKCATTLASIFNLVMILLDGVVIFCCWKKDYSLHDYSFLLHSGANYCIILFITVLLTMMGYCRGIFFYMSNRFILFIVAFIIEDAMYGTFIWFVNSTVVSVVRWLTGPAIAFSYLLNLQLGRSLFKGHTRISVMLLGILKRASEPI